MEIRIENGLLQIIGEKIVLKNLKAKVFYDGPTFNTLEQLPHGEWKISERDGETVCACDNFIFTVKEEKGDLLLKTVYVNDTGAPLRMIRSFDALNCEWDCKIDCAFCNLTKGNYGSVFAEMGSPSIKRRLCDGEQVESADFTAFLDGKGNNAAFGFCTFHEYFSTVNVCADGYLVATALTECKTLAEGERLESDWMYVHKTQLDANDAVDAYAKKTAERMGVQKVKEPVNGFCTWYYYGPNISEESVLKDLEEVAAHKEIPYRLFQIDDGWFQRRGDFVENEKFRSMRGIAEKIKSYGLVPGIWVDPHIADEESEVYKNHPDWFVKTLDGKYMHPAHALDFSHPEAEKWLYDLFKKLTEEWGYEYIKVDLIAPALCEGSYYDPSFNSLKNYRRSFEIIRRAVGDDVFILSCSSPIMAAVGLADSVRSSVDIFERYASLLDVFGRSLNRSYLGKNLIVNDADCLLLRKAENEDGECFRNCVRNDREIETYITAMLASGSPIIHSDKLSLLSEAQFRLLASLFPLLGRPAKCVNFLQESIPSVLDFGRCGNFEILAFINWGENEKKTFTLDRKGYVFEYWRKEFYGYSDGRMDIEVPAHEVKLFTISNGEGIVPLGVDDTILPQLQWKYQDGALEIELLKDGEGVYVYADRDVQSNCNYEKVGDDVYLVKGGKRAERVIIK